MAYESQFGVLRKNLGCIIVQCRIINIHQKQLITWKKNVHLDVKKSEHSVVLFIEVGSHTITPASLDGFTM